MLLGKAKVDSIDILIDSCISHDEFVSVDNVLREYNETKEEIKLSETSVEHTI